MATKVVTNAGITVATTESLADTETSEVIEVGELDTLSAQTIGDATTVSIEGSNINDDAEFVAIVTVTGEDIENVSPIPRFVRAVATGGTDTIVIFSGN